MARGSGRIRSVADGDDAPQSMVDRIQNLIDEQLLRIEDAKEGDARREERDELADYYEQLRLVTDRKEQDLEDHQLDSGLAGKAQAAILQSGRNALRRSPHNANRLSEGEIAAIEGMNDPRLLNNQAALTAMNATRQQIRESLPVEIVGSSEYQQLLEVTKPRRVNGPSEENAFASQSAMRGETRSEVRAGRIQELVERVDEQIASDEVQRLREQGITDEEELASAGATCHEVVDRMSRKRRRGEEVTAEDVQLVANHRLRLMEGLRDYIPKWAPENPQRWISMGDRYVFDMSLAAVPEELIRDTAAYEGMQDLMRNQALFTLRAPEHAEDAIGRKSSEMRREAEASSAVNREAQQRVVQADTIQPRPFTGANEWLA